MVQLITCVTPACAYTCLHLHLLELRLIPDPKSENPTTRSERMSFYKLRTVPDQMRFTVAGVRTQDDALLDIKFMIFYQLEDIDKMLNATHDPTGDSCRCALLHLLLSSSLLNTACSGKSSRTLVCLFASAAAESPVGFSIFAPIICLFDAPITRGKRSQAHRYMCACCAVHSRLTWWSSLRSAHSKSSNSIVNSWIYYKLLVSWPQEWVQLATRHWRSLTWGTRQVRV